MKNQMINGFKVSDTEIRKKLRFKQCIHLLFPRKERTKFNYKCRKDNQVIGDPVKACQGCKHFEVRG